MSNLQGGGSTSCIANKVMLMRALNKALIAAPCKSSSSFTQCGDNVASNLPVSIDLGGMEMSLRGEKVVAQRLAKLFDVIGRDLKFNDSTGMYEVWFRGSDEADYQHTDLMEMERYFRGPALDDYFEQMWQ